MSKLKSNDSMTKAISENDQDFEIDCKAKAWASKIRYPKREGSVIVLKQKTCTNIWLNPLYVVLITYLSKIVF